ncbi:MAG: MFS transporter [Promethearchaeota archaeon]
MKLKKREKISLIIFLFLIAIMLVDQALVIPNQVLIAADLNVYFDMIGIMMGAYTLIMGISTLVFGYFTDIFKRKYLLIFAGFLWSFTAIFHMFVEFFWQLFLVRMLAAVALGVTAPVTFSYLSDVISSDSRSKAFAFWGLITTGGILVAGALALGFNKIPYDKIDIESSSIKENMAYIAENFTDLLGTWRYPFLILGVIALIITILAIFLTKEPYRAGSEKVFEELPPEDLKYSYKIKLSDLKYIFKRKSNFFLIMNFFDVIGTGLLLAFLFPLITIEMGISFTSAESSLYLIILILFVGVVGLVVGQIVLAHWADKRVQSGEISARVKVATTCTILNTPFLLFAFAMSPNTRNYTYFFGILSVNQTEFLFLWIIFSALLGIGFAFTMGIGPNWYSSVMDINLPENRGTMIAVATFIDTIGRALGAILGGFLIVASDSIYEAVLWTFLWAGIISLIFWVPLFFICDKDYNEVNRIMGERAEKIKSRVLDEKNDKSKINKVEEIK